MVVFRWAVRGVTAVLLLAVSALALSYYLAARSLPDYDVTQPVRGLTGPVEIVRDHSNVPHIFGRSDADVFFALGYAHAQDRLWQLDLMRRLTTGRLSEVLDPTLVEADLLFRALDFPGKRA